MRLDRLLVRTVTLSVAAALLLVSCGPSATTVTEPPACTPESMSLEASNYVVEVGKTLEIEGTLIVGPGGCKGFPTVTQVWTSSDPSKATVSNTGVVTGVAVGTTTITVTAGGKTATATVTVK